MDYSQVIENRKKNWNMEKFAIHIQFKGKRPSNISPLRWRAMKLQLKKMGWKRVH